MISVTISLLRSCAVEKKALVRPLQLVPFLIRALTGVWGLQRERAGVGPRRRGDRAPGSPRIRAIGRQVNRAATTGDHDREAIRNISTRLIEEWAAEDSCCRSSQHAG